MRRERVEPTCTTSCGTSGDDGTDAPALTPSRAPLFGGYVSNGSQGGHYDDTWEWSGSSWSQRSSTGSSGPSGRVGGALASLNGKAVLFGGYSGKTLGDT